MTTTAITTLAQLDNGKSCCPFSDWQVARVLLVLVVQLLFKDHSGKS
jgi:hypothetical protein